MVVELPGEVTTPSWAGHSG